VAPTQNGMPCPLDPHDCRGLERLGKAGPPSGFDRMIDRSTKANKGIGPLPLDPPLRGRFVACVIARGGEGRKLLGDFFPG
jgi:hypothetical protein